MPVPPFKMHKAGAGSPLSHSGILMHTDAGGVRRGVQRCPDCICDEEPGIPSQCGSTACGNNLRPESVTLNVQFGVPTCDGLQCGFPEVSYTCGDELNCPLLSCYPCQCWNGLYVLPFTGLPDDPKLTCTYSFALSPGDIVGDCCVGATYPSFTLTYFMIGTDGMVGAPGGATTGVQISADIGGPRILYESWNSNVFPDCAAFVDNFSEVLETTGGQPGCHGDVTVTAA